MKSFYSLKDTRKVIQALAQTHDNYKLCEGFNHLYKLVRKDPKLK